VLAAPLAKQIGGAEISNSTPPARGVLFAGVAVALLAGTFAYASVHRFEPHTHGSPVAAVAALKKLNLTRVFNDYDFGGYLISNGVAPSSTAAPNSTVKNSSSTTMRLPD
jgi:hypothetical protein